MITKRSNHIPTFTKMDTTNNATTLVRTFLDQSSHGNSPLQMFIVQLAHQNGPNARYQKAARSCGLPPNQAVKFSEEHTSELQSQSNLVCRLLLEKKKKNHIRTAASHFLPRHLYDHVRLLS